MTDFEGFGMESASGDALGASTVTTVDVLMLGMAIFVQSTSVGLGDIAATN